MAPDLPDRSDFEAEIEAAIERVFDPLGASKSPVDKEKKPAPEPPPPSPEPTLELIPEEKEAPPKTSGKEGAKEGPTEESNEEFLSLSLEEIAPQEVEQSLEPTEALEEEPSEDKKEDLNFENLLESVEASVRALDWEFSPRYLEEFQNWLEKLQALGGETAEIASLMEKAGERLKDPSKATPETMALLYRALGLLKALAQGKDISKGLEKLRQDLGAKEKSPPPETPEGLKDLLELQSNLLKKCLHLLQTFEKLFRRVKGLGKLAESCAQIRSEIEFALSIVPEWIDIDLGPAQGLPLAENNVPAPTKPPEEEKNIEPPDYKVVHCFAGEREFVVPQSQVGFLDKLPKRVHKKLLNSRVFKAYWLKWPFIRLNKKFRGALSQISENRLLTFSAPFVPLSPTAEMLIILWDGKKALALGIDEALEFELPPKTRLYPTEAKAYGLVEIDGVKIPYYGLEHLKENFWGQDL